MFLPIGLKVEGKLCLLVGAGNIAAHKCQTLLEYGARVRVVAQAFNDEQVWCHDRVEKISSAYDVKHLAGASLVIAATSDPHTNATVAEDSQAAGMFVLRVDSPQECDWIMPATLRRGAFTVSFSTDGLFPSLAARVKQDSSAIFGNDLARLCEEAKQLRHLAERMQGDERRRKSPLRDLADSLDQFWYLSGIREHVTEAQNGKVYLVGAGPGDPGLITVKGAECLRAATVVIHDALANSELLDMYGSGALRVDVSKRKGRCLHMQPDINQMLIDWAKKGHTVVRLKGGDPMIFGRGGEEARALAAAGIDFEIVPGVSSLSAVPAYAGIPVTDREYGAASVGVYSLHRRSAALNDEQWRKIAEGAETLVLFMGMTLLPEVVLKLQTYGRKGSTPIALITQGTTADQREVVATLNTILDCTELKGLPGPGLIVVGNVVQAKGLMGWFNPFDKSRTDVRHSSVESRVERQIEVVLVRHAEIEEQYQGRYIGSKDVPLGDKGLQQAVALATKAELHKPGIVFASPMRRVRQTLEAVLPNSECTWLDDLREIDFGNWENQTFAEIAENDPINTGRWAKLDGGFEFPGGESLESFQRRISKVAQTVLDQAYADEQCERVFIFTHGGVIRALIGHWLGLPMHTHLLLEVSRASVSTLRLYGERGVLTKLNDTGHLQNLPPELAAK